MNNGDPLQTWADTYDIDDDNDTDEPLPDRGMNDRQVNPSDCIDMSAYENQVEGTCDGDITDDSGGGPDGDVGDPSTWCTTAGAGRAASRTSTPDPCGDSVVNVDDLLFVINNWGSCSSFAGGGPSLAEAIVILQQHAADHPEPRTWSNRASLICSSTGCKTPTSSFPNTER